jgi:membrane protein implicated in regulation of membrane protease activity
MGRGKVVITSTLIVFALYLAAGFVFAIPFVVAGVQRLDRNATQGTWGFRLVIFPGTILLWPLLARRWLSGAHEPPEENTAHRRAARG